MINNWQNIVIQLNTINEELRDETNKFIRPLDMTRVEYMRLIDKASR